MKKFTVSAFVFILAMIMLMSSAFAFTTLTVGSRGANVKKVQQVLKDHGYSLSIDGIYGSKTANCVKQYQKAHSLTVDGKVGPKTWASMTGVSSGGSSSSKSSSSLPLGLNSRGALVKKAQTVLKNHNFSVKADGIYGSKTQYYVKLYQKMHHLTVDGKVGNRTWDSMMNDIDIDDIRLEQPKTKLPLAKSSKNDDVKFIQKILKAHRYPVTVDGSFGAKTEKYVKLYQKAHYIKADGKVGADTWKSMAFSYTLKPYPFPKAEIAMTPSRFPINAESSSSAEDIKKIQKALEEKDPEQDLVLKVDGEYTGVFDQATADAVKEFQQRNSLAVTDPVCVDIATWEALAATEGDKYNISLLAKIISCESGSANDYEHIAIANVIIDYAANKGKRSIEAELKSGRYSPCKNWANFMKKSPGQRCYTNARRAYYGKENIFGGKKAYYFHNTSVIPSPKSWWRTNCTRYGLVDKHVFYG